MLLLIGTAILAALILGVKLSNDIFPRPLKKWLLKKAISNWMRSQPQKFGKEFKIYEKTTTEDTGVIPNDDEVLVERPVQNMNAFLKEEYSIYGTDCSSDNGLFVNMKRFPDRQSHVDVFLQVKGNIYNVSYEGETPSLSEFSLGNLKFEMVEPFRVWRIWYNGIMRNNLKGKGEGELVHITLNFLWKALDNPMDSRRNGNPLLLADTLCSMGLFGENLPTLFKILPEGYAQMGTLHGHVNIGNTDSQLEHELYLYGFRSREIENSDTSMMSEVFPMVKKKKTNKKSPSTERIELFGIADNGNGFRLNARNGNWTSGNLLWASYETNLVTNVDCPPSEIIFPKIKSTLFNLSDKKGTLRVEFVQESTDEKLPGGTRLALLKMRINGIDGRGILVSTTSNEGGTIRLPCVGESHKDSRFSQDESSHLVEFTNPACLNVSLVGGKGASLAKLQSLNDRLANSGMFARGFCLTTDLFRETLNLAEFKDIFKEASNNSNLDASKTSLDKACSRVMETILKCERTQRITTLISKQLEVLFGANRENIRFAIRSSGVLEDASDLSCAGQNATFLGVPEALITEKVLECWASLYTTQSVSYRLNHGQPAVSEMAVVVQEMVDAASAGVIFTADPRTGNPFEMIVTANYGLGESVVSGKCDPDTITLVRKSKSIHMPTDEHRRDSTVMLFNKKWWSEITMGKKVLGEKKMKIVSKTENGVTTTEEVFLTEDESNQFCLDEETILKLGAVATEIEYLLEQFKPVDIEWAVDKKGRIFILQCRNLTALDSWTDFEIMHELDSPIRNKADQFTTANTGEVLPKPLHTLTQTLNRYIDVITQELVYLRKRGSWPVSTYRSNTCLLFQQRLFINMFQTLYATVEDKEVTIAAVCIDQTIFGRQVITEEIRQIAEERFGIASGLTKLGDFLQTIKAFWDVKALVEGRDKLYHNFKLDYSKVPKTPKDIYGQMTQDLIHIYQTGVAHLITSSNSSASQVFLFMFLSEGKKPSEWDSSLYEDASKLLSVFSSVESAEIPNDMNKLIDEIIKHGGEKIEEFVNESSPTKAIEWMRANANIHKALSNFFEKHGHRGICEMDLGEPSWRNDPTTFLPILRSTLKNKLKNGGNDAPSGKIKPTFKDDDELLDSLSSNLKPMTRRLLKLILPTCRNAVIYREKTKSLFVRVGDQFKEKYNALADLMVQENLLPSKELIIFLNHFEIGQLIKKDLSSSVILQKAMKRSKIYRRLEELEFPEICVGMPKEIDTSVPVEVTDTIQATPVSRGVAKGIAKVCLSVEEASEKLQAGDILITHGTDVAWSPFFPILGGVVTELGGLISHGAVVAREYGLPCIVGASNATKIFKTGDRVVLDAGKGKLSKILNEQ